MTSRLLLTIATAAVLGCGGSAATTTPNAPTPAGFAGTYATRVTLTTNTCGTVDVQDNPTVVTHDAPTGAVTFTHVGLTYSGTVKNDGTFSTTPRAVNVNDGFAYSIALTGRFRTAAFDADATVDRTGGSGPCRFTVHWAATK